MIHIFVVASPPRSGTTWYSELFTTDRSYCFHELTNLLRPEPGNQVLDQWLSNAASDHGFEALQRRSILQTYSEYFLRHWEQSRRSGQFTIGNSDWYLSPFLPGVWLLWPDTKFLISFRNGINVVESLRGAPFQAVHQAIHPDLRDGFEGLCRFWVKRVEAITLSKRWLEDHGAFVLETRLERVTTDPVELERIWVNIVGHWSDYRDRNLSLQSKPLNTRTNHDRVVSWEEIWGSWKRADRKAFATISGEVQQQLGYELPGS